MNISQLVEQTATQLAEVIRGGPGSGHYDHEGRPGEVGGSQPSGEAEWFAPDGYHAASKRMREIQKEGGFAIVQRIGANFVVIKNIDEALDRYAKDIRKFRNENLYMLDSGYGQVFNKDGTRSTIRFGFDERQQLEGHISIAHERGDRVSAIHNHPVRHGLDFPPSLSDFQFAMGFRLDEFRVTSRNGQWIVRNTGKVEKFGSSHMERIAKDWTGFAVENLERLTGFTGDPYELKSRDHKRRMLDDADYASTMTDFHRERAVQVTDQLGWYTMEWKSHDE